MCRGILQQAQAQFIARLLPLSIADVTTFMLTIEVCNLIAVHLGIGLGLRGMRHHGTLAQQDPHQKARHTHHQAQRQHNKQHMGTHDASPDFRIS